MARNNDVIKRLVVEAKKQYEADAEHRVHIFLADHYGYWRWNGARQKRPMSSIVLEPGVKDMIVADCKDFMRSEDVRRVSSPALSIFARLTRAAHSGTPSAGSRTAVGTSCTGYPGLARRASYMRWRVSSAWTSTS